MTRMSSSVEEAAGNVPGPAELVIPCPVLVGRARESAVLSGALDAARAGRGGVVFLVGEAGIGKSRLVHEVASIAVQRRAPVLRGRAVPGSGAAALRPLTEAFTPLVAGRELDRELEAWRPALSAIVPTLVSPDAAEPTAPLLGEAVVRLLQRCTPAGGLLVLEDLHWADLETVGVVEHLCDNLERAPVLCLATVRSEEPSPARDLAHRVASRRAAPTLELGRLNHAQIAAMVHSCTGGSDADAVERAVSLSDGVPFLVEEMLAAPGLPASFAEGVDSRLAELGEPERRVLVTAAAFGRHFDWRLLEAATRLAKDDVIGALDRGVATQLLAVDDDGFRFRHALTAEAVLQSVTPPHREQRAADALAALDAAYPELPPSARQVAARLAERAGQHERAGQLHLALGTDALDRGALRTAVVALERATALLVDGDVRDAACERLVDALVLAGRIDDALALGDDLVTRLEPPRAAAVHLRLAGAAATAARWDLAAGHLGDATTLTDSTTPPSLQAELALRAAEIALGTSETVRAEQHARAALDVARAGTLVDQECAALQLLGRCARRSSLEAADAWFREALAAAERHGLSVWRLRALHELGTIALLDRSEVTALLEAQQLAEKLGAMATATVLDIEIAAGYAGIDDFDAQSRHGMQAARRGRALGLDLVAAYGWQHVAVAALLRGDGEVASRAAAEARAALPGNRDIEGLLVGAEMIGKLLADELDAALAAAQRCAEVLRGSQTAPPAYSRAALPLLLALARRSDAVAALDEIEQAGITVTRGGHSWAVLARAVLAGRTDGARAATLAAEADAQLAHMPMWRSLGRRLVGEAAAADGWTIPDQWLAEAEAWFRRDGHFAAAATCARLRGAEPAAVPDVWARHGITRREADVLALVIEGCSNREIADRLYVSVRTVEKHVESLLRKTATRTRTQLARVAGTT
jgi:DNA-binding CsgD family transcriptional regulator